MQTRISKPGVHGQGSPEERETRQRSFAKLGLRAEALHRLDYEDLALSAGALRLVRRAALTVLRRFGAVAEGELSPARALALFLDHVLWDEQSGGLILCADFPDASFCVPIARGEWDLRERRGRVQ